MADDLKKMQPQEPDSVVGRLLAALKKHDFEYKYPSNGLPEVTVQSAPAEYVPLIPEKQK